MRKKLIFITGCCSFYFYSSKKDSDKKVDITDKDFSQRISFLKDDIKNIAKVYSKNSEKTYSFTEIKN